MRVGMPQRGGGAQGGGVRIWGEWGNSELAIQIPQRVGLGREEQAHREGLSSLNSKNLRCFGSMRRIWGGWGRQMEGRDRI